MANRSPKPAAERTGRSGRRSAELAPLRDEIAHTRDGRDITRPFTAGLQEPRDPNLLGAVDWGVYDRILKDDQVFATLQQRRTAVVSRNWSVSPGDDKDPRSVAAAVRFNETISRIGWDRICDKMLYAIFHGYAVAEILWHQADDGLLDFRAIKVRHARRFRYHADGTLRLLTTRSATGEQLPERKFWVVAMGGSDDDDVYGRGLAEWLYWPVVFKRNGLRFWNTFLDKFGSPTAVAKYRPGMSAADRNNLLEALAAIATDTGIAVPEGVAIDFLQVARSGTADYATLCRYMDEAITKIILSQTMTTQDGASLSQAKVHAGVKLEVVKADDDLLSDSFNSSNGPARWWTDLNYGADIAAPIVTRDVAEEADTKAEADTDSQLKALGWERTEESFRDTYGEGYRRITAPAMTGAPAAGRSDPSAQAANDDSPDKDLDDPSDDKDRRLSFAADEARPLYVYRKLLNARDLVSWAKAQGLTSILDPRDMHVTVTYSRRPVNWMKMGGFWGWTGDNGEHLVPPGGPRMIERFDGGAVVLIFFSGHLDQRHHEMREAGASWDHPQYFPHVTLTYAGADVDLSSIEPYRGELRFGPEIFEPIEDAWSAQIREMSFSQPPDAPQASLRGVLDDGSADDGPSGTDTVVDQVVEQAGYRAAKALTDPILGAIRTANSAEELAELLGAPAGDPTALGVTMENAAFAARAAFQEPASE